MRSYITAIAVAAAVAVPAGTALAGWHRYMAAAQQQSSAVEYPEPAPIDGHVWQRVDCMTPSGTKAVCWQAEPTSAVPSDAQPGEALVCAPLERGGPLLDCRTGEALK
jgi:hypothetical protein